MDVITDSYIAVLTSSDSNNLIRANVKCPWRGEGLVGFLANGFVIIPRTIINSKSSLKSESEGKWWIILLWNRNQVRSRARRRSEWMILLWNRNQVWESWHAAKELKELFQKAASSYDAVRLGADLFYLRVHILYFSLHVQILLIFPILSDSFRPYSYRTSLATYPWRLVDMSKPGCRTVVVQSDLPLL